VAGVDVGLTCVLCGRRLNVWDEFGSWLGEPAHQDPCVRAMLDALRSLGADDRHPAKARAARLLLQRAG
jgi:hypothetical protein